MRKKSLIDSGIELFFKKNSRGIKEGALQQSQSLHASGTDIKTNLEVIPIPLGNNDKSGHSSTDDGHKWKLFDTIKIHSDKKRSYESLSQRSESNAYS